MAVCQQIAFRFIEMQKRAFGRGLSAGFPLLAVARQPCRKHNVFDSAARLL